VITSEANVKDQIDTETDIYKGDGDTKVWLKEVTGYDENDPVNGYAGILGKPITSLRVSGGQKYRVHMLNDKNWGKEVTGNDKNDGKYGYAGNPYVSSTATSARPIDGVAIDDVDEYCVHLLDGDWLPAVFEYNIKDSINGYAGVLGKPIDAIKIKGRAYAVSYMDISNSTNKTLITDKCAAQGGTCMGPRSCSRGTIQSNLCPNENDNYKCCIPDISTPTDDDTQNNQNNSKVLITVFIITASLAVIMIIIVIVMFYHEFSKNKKKQQSNSFDELPPYPYPNPRVVEEDTMDLQEILSFTDKMKLSS